MICSKYTEARTGKQQKFGERRTRFGEEFACDAHHAVFPADTDYVQVIESYTPGLMHSL
jgi:hypothetical protein